jgi:hypothetical protein
MHDPEDYNVDKRPMMMGFERREVSLHDRIKAKEISHTGGPVSRIRTLDKPFAVERFLVDGML